MEETVKDLQTRKGVVIGPVGSGKTGLCRYVCGLYEKNEKSKMSGISVSKGVYMYQGQYIKIPSREIHVQYRLIDSEGYGADNFSTDALKNQLISVLQFETDFNCLLIVASFERFRNGLKEDLEHLIGVINTLGLQNDHTVLCLTHCESYTDKVRAQYKKEFMDYFGLKLKDEDVIFCCFPNIDEINETFQPLIVEEVKKSIELVRSKLYEKSNPINVAMKIKEMEAK